MEVIVIFGVPDGFTTIVICVAVAVGTEGHIAEDVITTLTPSPLAKVDVVKVEAFVPVLFPFTFH